MSHQREFLPRTQKADANESRNVVTGLAGDATPQHSATKDLPSATGTHDRNPSRIRIRLLLGDIGEAGEPGHTPFGEALAIDAIAVGHYKGVAPVDAERALDLAISRDLSGQSEEDLVITQLYERGIVIGDAARPFFLSDPRRRDRIIAIAGMGYPGRFGVTELTVMVRELCWSLGRLGKKHLATVLIGSGNGNIEADRALDGWIRGLRSALEEPGPHIEAVTFVEIVPKKLMELHEELRRQADNLRAFGAEFMPLAQAEIDEALKRRAPLQRPPKGVPPPTRLTAELVSRKYRYSALTDTASVPERRVQLDSRLVLERNAKLLDASDEATQLEWGRSLCNLLIPEELRPHLMSSAPLAVICDTTTARLPWEMLAPPGIADNAKMRVRPEDSFLGLSRGLTRQLKIPVALPSNLPHRSGKTLNVLIVADPSKEKPLAAARTEARLLCDLFKDYSESKAARDAGNYIEVNPLIGAEEATRNAVLNQLQQRSHDVLHFAGHCDYHTRYPSASGWIFSKGERLTAEDLSLVERVPRFIFSNACESGVMPDRAKLRFAKRAPSFAEAFFLRGVAEFVCTAWAINDQAAREFAITLYSQLLGVGGPPRPMYIAMQEARRHVRTMPGGVRTWGAYQHYGDPYCRLFRLER